MIFYVAGSSRIEVSYQEAVALKRQEELIREEEAAGQAENELKSKRIASEKEKRAKKKQVFYCILIIPNFTLCQDIGNYVSIIIMAILHRRPACLFFCAA